MPRVFFVILISLAAGCLKPECEASLGTLSDPSGLFEPLKGGLYSFQMDVPVERRDGLVYLPGSAPLVDDITFTAQTDRFTSCPRGPGWVQEWIHASDRSYLRSELRLFGAQEQLLVQDQSVCEPDGGFGPALLHFELSGFTSVAVSLHEGAWLTCVASVTDAGAPLDVHLLAADGGIVSRYPTTESRDCLALRPPLALVGGRVGHDYRRELVRFDSDGGVRVAFVNAGLAPCAFGADDALLCADNEGGLTLFTPPYQQGIELLRAAGAWYRIYQPSLRGHQFVQRFESDGGNAFYLRREQSLSPLGEGLPLSTIGDWDDDGGVVIVTYGRTDAGQRFAFQRRCLQ